MKANELMIGDWVYVSKNFTQKYHKIRALSNDEGAVLRGIYVNEYGIKTNSVFSPNDTEPIPLTPEILKKNGFVKGYMFNNVWNYIEDYKRLVIVYTGEVFNIQDTLIEFKHVHELQHILKICGIEKEIIL